MGREYGPDQTFNKFTDCLLGANKHCWKVLGRIKEKDIEKVERDIEKW